MNVFRTVRMETVDRRQRLSRAT